jgi:hypothetical protein
MTLPVQNFDYDNNFRHLVPDLDHQMKISAAGTFSATKDPTDPDLLITSWLDQNNANKTRNFTFRGYNPAVASLLIVTTSGPKILSDPKIEFDLITNQETLTGHLGNQLFQLQLASTDHTTASLDIIGLLPDDIPDSFKHLLFLEEPLLDAKHKKIAHLPDTIQGYDPDNKAKPLLALLPLAIPLPYNHTIESSPDFEAPKQGMDDLGPIYRVLYNALVNLATTYQGKGLNNTSWAKSNVRFVELTNDYSLNLAPEACLIKDIPTIHPTESFALHNTIYFRINAHVERNQKEWLKNNATIHHSRTAQTINRWNPPTTPATSHITSVSVPRVSPPPTFNTTNSDQARTEARKNEVSLFMNLLGAWLNTDDQGDPLQLNLGETSAVFKRVQDDKGSHAVRPFLENLQRHLKSQNKRDTLASTTKFPIAAINSAFITCLKEGWISPSPLLDLADQPIYSQYLSAIHFLGPLQTDEYRKFMHENNLQSFEVAVEEVDGHRTKTSATLYTGGAQTTANDFYTLIANLVSFFGCIFGYQVNPEGLLQSPLVIQDLVAIYDTCTEHDLSSYFEALAPTYPHLCHSLIVHFIDSILAKWVRVAKDNVHHLRPGSSSGLDTSVVTEYRHFVNLKHRELLMHLPNKSVPPACTTPPPTYKKPKHNQHSSNSKKRPYELDNTRSENQANGTNPGKTKGWLIITGNGAALFPPHAPEGKDLCVNWSCRGRSCQQGLLCTRLHVSNLSGIREPYRTGIRNWIDATPNIAIAPPNYPAAAARPQENNPLPPAVAPPRPPRPQAPRPATAHNTANPSRNGTTG